jgi:SAM-dependent methyltransferase
VSSSSLFSDTNAQFFARDIDSAIKDGCYRRGELFVEFAQRTLPAGSLILDYGCGPGRISLLLARAGFEVLGVDPSAAMIALAEGQDTRDLRVQFRTGDDSLLRPDSYDAIVCSSVIEYVREPDKLLQVFRNSLRREGALIISYSNNRSLSRLLARFTPGKNPFANAYRQGWGRLGFRKLLARNGFRSVAGPIFFDFHWRLDRFLWWLPLGMLGIVAARVTTSEARKSRE